jgi:hypothetical protein
MKGETYYFKKRRVTMKKDLTYLVTISLVLVACGVFVTSGCSQPVKTLGPGIKGPQLIVNPEVLRLGVAKVMETNIVFSGSGFDPGDSVFIKLLDVPVNGKKEDLAIASADVKEDGTFNAPVGKLTKATDFLRAKIGENKKGKPAPVISRPPMPAGTYTGQAVSMLSDKKADCILNIKEPSCIDRLKDWLGVKMGKIVRK